jgi:hypothetical protein
VEVGINIMLFSYTTEPSESPANVSVIPLNATAVSVTWDPPPPEHRNGIIQGFSIRVVGVHTPEDYTVSTISTDTLIRGLHPFYSYKFTVAAVTTSHGPFSNPITVMIPPFGKSMSSSLLQLASHDYVSVHACKNAYKCHYVCMSSHQ